jgi:hypothetical protein
LAGIHRPRHIRDPAADESLVVGLADTKRDIDLALGQVE